MNSHAAFLLKRFRNVFGEPKAEDPEILMAEYARSMKSFTSTAIELAGNALIDGFDDRGRPRKFWPTPAEVKAACNEAAARLHQEAKARQPKPKPAPAPQPPSSEQIQRIDTLIVELRRSMAEAKAVMEPDRSDTNWRAGMRDQFEGLQRRSRNEFIRRRA